MEKHTVTISTKNHAENLHKKTAHTHVTQRDTLITSIDLHVYIWFQSRVVF